MTKNARIYSGVKTVYLINGVGKTGQIHAKNESKSLSYTTCKKKWIKDLKIRPETI